MRARGVEPLLLTVSKAELILAEERKRQRQTPPGVVVRKSVHKPSPFEKENSVGGIRPQPSAGRSPKTNGTGIEPMKVLSGQ
jgi:hypothetical protein